jgi:hypothetical protein
MSSDESIRRELERGLSSSLVTIPEQPREQVLHHIGALLHVQTAERMRCVEICRKRAVLWRSTRSAPGGLGTGRGFGLGAGDFWIGKLGVDVGRAAMTGIS